MAITLHKNFSVSVGSFNSSHFWGCWQEFWNSPLLNNEFSSSLGSQCFCAFGRCLRRPRICPGRYLVCNRCRSNNRRNKYFYSPHYPAFSSTAFFTHFWNIRISNQCHLALGGKFCRSRIWNSKLYHGYLGLHNSSFGLMVSAPTCKAVVRDRKNTKNWTISAKIHIIAIRS